MPITVGGAGTCSAHPVSQTWWIHVLRRAEKSVLKNAGDDLFEYGRLRIIQGGSGESRPVALSVRIYSYTPKFVHCKMLRAVILVDCSLKSSTNRH